MDFTVLFAAQLVLLIFSIGWYYLRNEELLPLFNGMFFYFGSCRYAACTWGTGRWGVLEAKFGVPLISDEAARFALMCFVLCQLVFTVTYAALQPKAQPRYPKGTRLDDQFVDWLRPRVLGLGVLFLPLAILARSSVNSAVYGEGKNAAFQVSSYMQLFPMGLIGGVILLLCTWRFGGMRTTFEKIVVVILMAGVAKITFGSFGRFQVIGWLLASFVVMASAMSAVKRIGLGLVIGCLAAALFSVAGALRDESVAFERTAQSSAVSRIMAVEDGNMIDGFTYTEAVYPSKLPFEFGREHLMTLLRPIPRKLWPGKPVGGGYQKYFGMVDADIGFTIGISPSIAGSMYAEGGVPGIVICSIAYGWLLAKLMRFAAGANPFLGLTIRAMVCVAVIPWTRGGDLPGIYAWLGMSFWPCLLLIWMKWKYFKRTPWRPPPPPQRRRWDGSLVASPTPS